MATQEQLQKIQEMLQTSTTFEDIHNQCCDILSLDRSSNKGEILTQIFLEGLDLANLSLQRNIQQQFKEKGFITQQESQSPLDIQVVPRSRTYYSNAQAQYTNRIAARTFIYDPEFETTVDNNNGIALTTYPEFRVLPIDYISDELASEMQDVIVKVTKKELETQRQSFTIHSDNDAIEQILRRNGVFDKLHPNAFGKDPVDVAINILRLKKSCNNDNQLKVPEREYGLLKDLLPEISKSVVFTQRTRRLFDIDPDTTSLIPNPNYKEMVVMTGVIPCLKEISVYDPQTDLATYCIPHITKGKTQHIFKEGGIEQLTKDYTYALTLQAIAATEQKQKGMSLVFPNDYLRGLEGIVREQAQTCYADAIIAIKQKFPDLELHVINPGIPDIESKLQGKGITLYEGDLIQANQKSTEGKITFPAMGNGHGKFGGGFLSPTGAGAAEENIYTVCPSLAYGAYSNQVFVNEKTETIAPIHPVGSIVQVKTKAGLEDRKVEKTNFNPLPPTKHDVGNHPSLAHHKYANMIEKYLGTGVTVTGEKVGDQTKLTIKAELNKMDTCHKLWTKLMDQSSQTHGWGRQLSKTYDLMDILCNKISEQEGYECTIDAEQQKYAIELRYTLSKDITINGLQTAITQAQNEQRTMCCSTAPGL